MADAINPFLAQIGGINAQALAINPKVGGKQTPAVQPYSPQAPQSGQGGGALAGFSQAIAGLNYNPQLSFLRGEAMTNMPLGNAEAINVKGGKAGIALNVIS